MPDRGREGEAEGGGAGQGRDPRLAVRKGSYAALTKSQGVPPLPAADHSAHPSAQSCKLVNLLNLLNLVFLYAACRKQSAGTSGSEAGFPGEWARRCCGLASPYGILVNLVNLLIY